MAVKTFTGDVRQNIAPEDKRFILKVAEPGFSPERNKAIVEQTITDYEVSLVKRGKQFDEHYAERADAVITYLRSLDKGQATSNLERYFGRKMLAHLRGQQIRDRLMSGLMVKNKQGQIIKR